MAGRTFDVCIVFIFIFLCKFKICPYDARYLAASYFPYCKHTLMYYWFLAICYICNGGILYIEKLTHRNYIRFRCSYRTYQIQLRISSLYSEHHWWLSFDRIEFYGIALFVEYRLLLFKLLSRWTLFYVLQLGNSY